MSALSAALRIDDRRLAVQLTVDRGSCLALLGGNGIGKTSTLECIAGLLAPTHGRIALGDRTLFDSAVGIDISPHRRRVALLAQRALLFPHLSVLANVEFASRTIASGRSVRNRAQHWLDRVGAIDLASRRPAELSGGQAQRVALARALAAEPHILLLDEPLAALDVTAAAQLRPLLRDLLREPERSSIVVTHDVIDAIALTDTSVVLESVDGWVRCAQTGSTIDVINAPRTTFTAELAGLNVFVGSAMPFGLITPDGLQIAATESDAAIGGACVAVFAANAVGIHRSRPASSERNLWPATIMDVTWSGGVARVRGQTTAGIVTADVTAAAAAQLALNPGTSTYFAVKATQVRIHARQAH